MRIPAAGVNRPDTGRLPCGLRAGPCRWAMGGLAVAVWLGLLVGCEDTPGARSPVLEAADLRAAGGWIAFMAEGPADPLWPLLKAGAERYRTRGGTLAVRYLVPADDDPRTRAKLLAGLNPAEVRALCIHSEDFTGILSELRRLHRAGMILVSIGAVLPENLAAAHVGWDDPAIGRALADAVGRTVAPEGTVMLLHAGLGHPTCGRRLWAFRERIKMYPGIELLAEIETRGDPGECLEIMQERSRRYPRLSAWVSLDDWPLRDIPSPETPVTPAASPPSLASALGGARLITTGGWPGQWEQIRQGRLAAVVAPGADDPGARALLFCENRLLSREPPRFEQSYLIPPRIVTANELEAWAATWEAWTRLP